MKLLVILLFTLGLFLPAGADIQEIHEKLAFQKISGAPSLMSLFKKASSSIDPAAGDALGQLVDQLQQVGVNASVYGEPKLNGVGIDKIVVDGKVYDVLVYFSGAKRWNPLPVYLRENDTDSSGKTSATTPGGKKGTKSKDHSAMLAAFKAARGEIDPTNTQALEQLAEAMRTQGFDAEVHPETDGDDNDKLRINGRLFDVLIVNHPPRRWNPFLIPIQGKGSKKATPGRTRKPVIQSKPGSGKKKSPPQGVKATGNNKGIQSSFLSASKGIDPASGSALQQLCQKLQTMGIPAKPWGEPKLNGKPVDKITVNGQVYDVLVFFDGAKRWNPCAVPLDR